MGYSHGHEWTEDELKQRISTMVCNLGMNRMPTCQEVTCYYDNATACAITRHIGWYNLAEFLNLPIKECETTTGKKHEFILADELSQKGFSVEKMPQNFPYDLLVNGSVKIDVKVSHICHGKSGYFYSFRVGKQFPTCDIYALRLVDNDGQICKTLIIPSKDVALNKQISVGAKNSKYNKYNERWDIIEKYADFMRTV